MNIEEQCRQWVNSMVVGLNLCPFAKRSIDNQGVRYVVFEQPLEELADAIVNELQLLDTDSRIETTLFIIGRGLEDFMDYLDVLDGANQLLEALDYEGVYQIASFHPNYQFASTALEDVTNYTNRAPYPIFHFLREAALESAIAAYGSDRAACIPDNNIALLQQMGLAKVKAYLK
jgi:hypothetical protein